MRTSINYTAPFKVIVSGRAHFTDYPFFKDKLDALLRHKLPRVSIHHGDSAGPDTLACADAAERWLPSYQVYAEQDHYGERAEGIRNQALVNNAHALVAFWDGQSHDT
jgi:hypothetical protein